MKSIPYVPFAPNYFHRFDVPEEKWIKIKPARFVYHLTKRGPLDMSDDEVNFKRLNIAMEGLYGVEKGFRGVWANHQINNIWALYPINIDAIMFNGTDLLQWLYSFDIWRIDTLSITNRWYVDPNHMLTHASHQTDYLLTRESIPAHALKLFEFEINGYEFLYGSNNMMKFSLKPVVSINRILDIQRNRQRNKNSAHFYL